MRISPHRLLDTNIRLIPPETSDQFIPPIRPDPDMKTIKGATGQIKVSHLFVPNEKLKTYVGVDLNRLLDGNIAGAVSTEARDGTVHIAKVG